VRILVTGAGGFVGGALCGVLGGSGHWVRAALRSAGAIPHGAAEAVVIGDIAADVDWSSALEGVDAVIHTAARAHIGSDIRSNWELYERTNSSATRRLAIASVESGVRRFVYLSSVKVNGEGSKKPYTSSDNPCPEDNYGRSKLLGEQYLLAAANESAMEAAIVRSPLVYGPGVRANFLRLMRWIDRGIPLPFGAIRNQRSYVSLWNLCSLLTHLLDAPMGPGPVWMVSDREDVSTPELMRRIGRQMGRSVRLIPIPESMLRLLGAVTGRQAEAARLCGSLTLDITKTCDQLQWVPPLSLDEGLKRTVRWYLTGVVE
jgi:nucleoside-diphosphate-sugar epimerase